MKYLTKSSTFLTYLHILYSSQTFSSVQLFFLGKRDIMSLASYVSKGGHLSLKAVRRMQLNGSKTFQVIQSPSWGVGWGGVWDVGVQG